MAVILPDYSSLEGKVAAKGRWKLIVPQLSGHYKTLPPVFSSDTAPMRVDHKFLPSVPCVPTDRNKPQQWKLLQCLEA